MNINSPYLLKYSSGEISSLNKNGYISSSFDASYNLLLENTSSMNVSAITIPLINYPVDPVKVESKYAVDFTEL